jgi:hypothetical protein
MRNMVTFLWYMRYFPYFYCFLNRLNRLWTSYIITWSRRNILVRCFLIPVWYAKCLPDYFKLPTRPTYSASVEVWGTSSRDTQRALTKRGSGGCILIVKTQESNCEDPFWRRAWFRDFLGPPEHYPESQNDVLQIFTTCHRIFLSDASIMLHHTEHFQVHSCCLCIFCFIVLVSFQSRSNLPFNNPKMGIVHIVLFELNRMLHQKIFKM